jgi:hypothetical protein
VTTAARHQQLLVALRAAVFSFFFARVERRVQVPPDASRMHLVPPPTPTKRRGIFGDVVAEAERARAESTERIGLRVFGGPQ